MTAWANAAVETASAAVPGVRTTSQELMAGGGGGTPTEVACGSDEAASGWRGEDGMAEMEVVQQTTGAISPVGDVGARIAAAVTAGSRTSRGNVREEALAVIRTVRKVAQPAGLKKAQEAPT